MAPAVILQRDGVLVSALRAVAPAVTPVSVLNSHSAVVIGMVHNMLPFFVFPVLASMAGVKNYYTKAAITLGAHPLRAFLTVVLRQIMGAMIASALFAFLPSFDEIVVTNLIGGGEITTLTLLTVLILAVAVLVQGKNRIFEMFSGGKADGP